jgi:predicted nucleic acid-binding protein
MVRCAPFCNSVKLINILTLIFLIDEKTGRRVAKLNQIKIIGSLGVLIEAKRKVFYLRFSLI